MKHLFDFVMVDQVFLLPFFAPGRVHGRPVLVRLAAGGKGRP